MADQSERNGITATTGLATAAGLTAARQSHAYFKRDAARRIGNTSQESVIPRAKVPHVSEYNSLAYYASEHGPLVNRYMRTGSVLGVQSESLTRILVAEVRGSDRAPLEAIYRRTGMDVTNILNRTEMPEATRLYRAMGTHHLKGGLRPGTMLQDAAVLSTTSDIRATDTFYDSATRKNTKPVTLVIDAGGAKGAALGSAARFGAEREVSLAPNTKLTVTRIETGVKRGLFNKSRNYAMTTTKAGAVAEASMGGRPGLNRAINAAGKAGVVMATAGPIIAGVNSYGRAASAGAVASDAIAQAMRDATITAAVGAVSAGAFVGLAAAAKSVAPRLAPALGPLGWAAAAGMAGYGAVQGYQASGTISGALKGAVGLDVTPVSTDPTTAALARIAPMQASRNKSSPGSTSSASGSMAKADAARFEAADAARVRASAPVEPADGNKRRGFQNPANMQAALAAQGRAWSGEYHNLNLEG